MTIAELAWECARSSVYMLWSFSLGNSGVSDPFVPSGLLCYEAFCYEVLLHVVRYLQEAYSFLKRSVYGGEEKCVGN